MFKRAIVLLVCVAVLSYAVDWVQLYLRHDPEGNFTVHRVYVVPLKNGRTEYTSQETLDQSCAHALFPHSDVPCWYLARHTYQEIKIDTGSRVEYPH
jgi:hypothetical protein